MATKKQNELNVDTVTQPQTENEDLKAQVSQLQSLVEKLLAAQSTSISPVVEQQSTVNVSAVEDDEIPVIAPNKMIQVTSLFYGGMTLKGVNSKPIRFERFGMTLPISYEDLAAISSNNRSRIEDGSIYINNKDAVKALYLEDVYRNIVNKQTIENIFDLPEDEIRKVYKNSLQGVQETIIDVVLDGVKRNIKDGDLKFSNRNKIEILSELSGKNLYKIANDQLEDK